MSTAIEFTMLGVYRKLLFYDWVTMFEFRAFDRNKLHSLVLRQLVPKHACMMQVVRLSFAAAEPGDVLEHPLTNHSRK